MKTRQRDCIRDCVDAWRQWDGEQNTATINWYRRLTDAGYPCVTAGARAMTQWPNMHDWCREHIGHRHYVWAGSTFWFERDQDATAFALTWG